MPKYPNLISDSLLINETIQLLQSFGGSVSAVKVVDYVMKIRKPSPDLAKLLVSDLAESDPRLRLNEDKLELVAIDRGNFNLTETDFVVFDLETTGAKCPPCRITEIGAFRVKHNEIVDRFHTLVNPETPIPPFITQLTGINDKMVKNSPRFTDIVSDFLDFIGDAVLVAHNAAFDMCFLNYEIKRIYENYQIANPHLCTVQLSRKLLPHIANHKLHTLADYYSIPLQNHHRAADDAHATAQIFINLLSELSKNGVFDLVGIKKFKA
jgi:DNA polymerase-3 subunit alpha (Gram-positive type)